MTEERPSVQTKGAIFKVFAKLLFHFGLGKANEQLLDVQLTTRTDGSPHGTQCEMLRDRLQGFCAESVHIFTAPLIGFTSMHSLNLYYSSCGSHRL